MAGTAHVNRGIMRLMADLAFQTGSPMVRIMGIRFQFLR